MGREKERKGRTTLTAKRNTRTDFIVGSESNLNFKTQNKRVMIFKN